MICTISLSPLCYTKSLFFENVNIMTYKNLTNKTDNCARETTRNWPRLTVSHHSHNLTTTLCSFTPSTLLYLQVDKIYSSEVWEWSLKPCCTLLAQFLVHFCYTLVAFLLLILATLWYTSEHSHASKLGFQQISQAVLDLKALLGTTL